MARAPAQKAAQEARRRALLESLRSVTGHDDDPLPAAAAVEAAPVSQDALPPEAGELEAQLDDLLRRLPRQDHFDRLGLARGATAEQARAAFVGLARQWHPDRFAGPLQAFVPKAQKVFTLLRDARDVLGDAEARRGYLAALEKGTQNDVGGDVVGRTEDAKLSSRKAEVYLKKRDYAAATAEYRSAVALEESGPYLAGLAWSLLLDPNRGADARDEVRRLLQRAMNTKKPGERAFYVAGILAKGDGDAAKAEQLFRKCLDVDEDHAEAARELRLLEMRRGGARGAASGAGLFDRFKRK